MSVQVCHAPIVLPPAHQAVAYSDVADALACLDNLVDFVFSGITKKIQFEKDKLSSLSSRIEAAHVKTQALVANRNAITVYSPAKYPSLTWQDSTPIFGDVKEPLVPQHTPFQVPVVKNVEGRKDDEKDLKHEVEAALLLEKQSAKPVAATGLGPLPTIHSVDNLLLFNSTENVYKNYVPVDNLARSMEKMKQKQKTKLDVLPLPPMSVLNSESMQLHGVQSLGWIPGPVDVPDLDIASNLPLSNIASDAQWVEKFPPIGPSDNFIPLPSLLSVLPIPDYEGASVPISQAGSTSHQATISLVNVEHAVPDRQPPKSLGHDDRTVTGQQARPTVTVAEPKTHNIVERTHQVTAHSPTITLPSPVPTRHATEPTSSTQSHTVPENARAVDTPATIGVPVSHRVEYEIPPPKPRSFLDAIERGVQLRPTISKSQSSDTTATRVVERTSPPSFQSEMERAIVRIRDSVSGDRDSDSGEEWDPEMD